MRITRIRRWALTLTVATVGLALLGGQHDISEATARPVIEKYTGVLGAVDVFTTAIAFTILESIASTSATA